MNEQPTMTLVQRAATATPRLVTAFGLPSLAGFALVAGLVLIYDAEAYASGPLAGFAGTSTGTLRLALVALGPVVFAVATWHRGVIGALAALVGYGFIGPFLVGLSPLHDEPSIRLVCCDGVRSLQFLSGALLGTGCFLIVAPVTLVVRSYSRRLRA